MHADIKLYIINKVPILNQFLWLNNYFWSSHSSLYCSLVGEFPLFEHVCLNKHIQLQSG